jgi:hypothetical protein
MERWKGKAWVDYSFHIALGGPLPLKTFEQIPDAIKGRLPEFQSFHQ